MNNEIEKKLWKKVGLYLTVLQVIPFVKMIAVCNNLAFGKVNERSDIDIFVIAEEGRLFFVRIFVTVLVHLLGVRRYGKKIAGRFCLSFFVDDSVDDLSAVAIDNDIYLAYWIATMKPVIDYDYSETFLWKNAWIEGFFEPNSEIKISHKWVLPKSPINSFFRSIFSVAFGGFVGDFLEKRLCVWQKKRAEKKALNLVDKSGLVVSDHMLKFHNNDMRKTYRDKWMDKYGDQKLTRGKFDRL